MKPFLLIGLLLLTTQVRGQQRVIDTQHIAWLGYYQKLQLTPSWSLHTELEGRWFLSNLRQHQWVVPRVHLHYMTAGGVDLAVGATHFLHAQPQNDEPVALIRPEWRGHQEVSLKQALGKSTRLEHRYRLEERFLQRVEKGALTEGWEYAWRFRYRLQFVVPLLPETKVNPTLKLYDEILLNAGKSIGQNIFDQNRLGATFSLKLSKTLATDLGYMHWFQQRSSGTAFFNRHILRLTLVHNLSLISQP